MPFSRRTGGGRFQVFESAGTIAAGDIVQFNESGEAVVGATNKGVIGIAVNAATSSTQVTVDVFYPGEEVNATISAGTMSASEIGQDADFADENDLTLTESNSDFRILGWDGVSTNKCHGVFTKLVYAGVGAE